jgi:hypothetical protein
VATARETKIVKTVATDFIKGVSLSWLVTTLRHFTRCPRTPLRYPREGYAGWTSSELQQGSPRLWAGNNSRPFKCMLPYRLTVCSLVGQSPVRLRADLPVLQLGPESAILCHHDSYGILDPLEGFWKWGVSCSESRKSGNGPAAVLSTAERLELTRLVRERPRNRVCKATRSVLSRTHRACPAGIFHELSAPTTMPVRLSPMVLSARCFYR